MSARSLWISEYMEAVEMGAGAGQGWGHDLARPRGAQLKGKVFGV